MNGNPIIGVLVRYSLDIRRLINPRSIVSQHSTKHYLLGLTILRFHESAVYIDTRIQHNKKNPLCGLLADVLNIFILD